MAERDLQIRARLRDVGFSRTLDKIRQKAKGFGKALVSPFAAAAKAVLNWRTALLSAIGATGLIAFTRQVADSGREMQLWADKLGVPVEKLSGLQFAVEQAGFEFDTLVEGLKTVQERMDDAARGSATQAEQFARLGLTLLDQDGKLRNVVDILPELSRAYQKAAREGGEELVLITEDIIGGSENLLSVWLQQGPEAIEAYLRRAKAIGAIVDRQYTEQANRFLRTWSETWALVRASSARVFAVIEPAITAGLEKLNEWLSAIGQDTPGFVETAIRTVWEWATWLLGQLGKWTVTGAGYIVKGVEVVTDAVGRALQAIKAGIFDVQSEIASSASRLIGALASALPDSAIQKRLQAFATGAGLAGTALGRMGENAEDAGYSVDFGSAALFEAAERAESFWNALSKLEGSHLPEWARELRDRMRELRDETFAPPPNVTRGGGAGGWLTDLQERADSFFGSMRSGAQSAWQSFRNMTEAGTQAGRQITTVFVDGLSAGLADAVLRVQNLREAWRSFRAVIVRALVEIAAKFVVVNTLALLFNALSGGFGALLGGGSGAAAGPAAAGFTPVSGASGSLFLAGAGGPRGGFSQGGFGSGRAPGRPSMPLGSSGSAGGGPQVSLSLTINALDSQSVVGAVQDPAVVRAITGSVLGFLGDNQRPRMALARLSR